ncbi:MAG: leucine-rich repeat protein [Clostridium sp.]|nr:leucine-rich repeat protein [Clostridium sp.]MCM1547408.1 leucine-rich repeat protein [Ruminococcus sp.]
MADTADITSNEITIDTSNIDLTYDSSQWYLSDEEEFFRDGIEIYYNYENVTYNSSIIFDSTPAEVYNGKSGEYYVDFTVEYNGYSADGSMPVKIFLSGDVNYDGVSDLQDVIGIAESLLKINNFTDEQRFIGDVDKDGKVGLYDAINMSKQIINEVPIDIIDVPYNDSISDSEKGIKIENVTCELGETVEIPINMVNVSSQGCVAVIECDEPLNISSVKSYMASKYADSSSSKIAALWTSGITYSSDFSSITIEVPADIEPGTYNVNIAVLQLEENGEYVENPIGISGTITVEEPEPTIDYPQTDYPTDDWTSGIGIEVGKVGSVQGAEVIVPVYLRGSGVSGGTILISADYPLDIVGFDQSVNPIVFETNEFANGVGILFVDIYDMPADTVLGYVKVVIDDDAVPGEYPINVSIEEMYDVDGYEIESTAIAGTVVVDEYIPPVDFEYGSYDSDDDGVDDVCEIYGILTTETTVDIPEEIDGLVVKSIHLYDETFANSPNLETINIPASVTGISDEYGDPIGSCKLVNINVAEENQHYSSIDGVLFNKDQTELICYPENRTETNYVIPDSVTHIGHCAFENNANLTEIVIPEGVTIDNCAFANCTALADVELPKSINALHLNMFENTAILNNQKGSIKYIGTWAFAHDENITTAKLKEGTEHIAYGFLNGITTVEIPKSFTDSEELKETPVENINVAEGNTSLCSVDGVLFSKDMTKLIVYPSGKKDTEYTVPEGVEILGTDSFCHCENLTKLNLSETLRLIDTFAFKECSNLNDLIISEGLETIADTAFFGMGFNELVFPKSLKSLGKASFTYSGADKMTFLNPETVIPYDPDNQEALFWGGDVQTITMIGYKGSTAEEYVKIHNTRHNITFKEIGEEPAKGDVDGNDKIDLYDAIIICKCIIGADDVTEEQKKYADVNGDGKIDLYDAIYVAECMIGMHKQ